MASLLSGAEIVRHNELHAEGSRLQKGLLLLDQRPPPHLGFFARRKLRKSIALFQEAIKINPTGWQSMMFIGKAHQSLNELNEALSWFLRAREIVPTNPSIAKEAGGMAGRLGQHDLAVQIMLPVADAHPNDPALQYNLGLSCLMAGQAQVACKAFERACRLEPGRDANFRLAVLAEKVRDGLVPTPKTEAEIKKVI
jgi:tetratricopeptide (TPR) repeat protein